MTIAILGSSEVDPELAKQSLADLRDAATEFDIIFGIDSETPEVIPELLDWCQENGVAYDLIIHPEVADDIPENYTNAADKIIKTKAVEDKTVARLLEYSGTHLLVLAGDAEPSPELQAAAMAANDGGADVLDLADALTPIDFNNGDAAVEADSSDEDTEAGDEKPDFELVGTEAEEGDADQQAQLTEWANEADISDEDQAEMTWLALAEMLNDLYDAANKPEPAAKPVKAAAKKAAAKSKTADDEPTGFTQEALDAMTLKDLRAVGAQSGIEGATKLGMKALKDALLGLDAPAEEAASTKGKVGTPLKDAPATGNTEVDEALSVVFTGLRQLATALGA